MKDDIITTLLFSCSITCIFLSMVFIYKISEPRTYEVYYTFYGQEGYAEVTGNPVEIIDELRSRQIIHNIKPR